MIRSIVVPVRPSASSRRGLSVAAALAGRARLPLRLVTVAPTAADVAHMEATLHEWAREAGPAACTATVVRSDDVVGSLVDVFHGRPDSLVVVGTRARSSVGRALLGSVAECLLARAERPLLLVGPHVDVTRSDALRRLAVGASASTVDALRLPVAHWCQAFDVRPRIVHVSPSPGDLGDAAPDPAARLVRELAAEGVVADGHVVRGDEPGTRLEQIAEEMGGAVIGVGTARWVLASQAPRASVARALVHRARHPVLVVAAIESRR